MNEKQDFEALRRLLALKRHEVPPPGFFEHFSGDVIARLRAGETETPSGWREPLPDRAPWLLRVWEAFQGKPAVAGGFAVALCSLLLVAVIYAQQPEPAPQALFPPVQPGGTPGAALMPASATPFAYASNPLLTAGDSTNPVMESQGAPSLFDQINRATMGTPPERASFTPDNN